MNAQSHRSDVLYGGGFIPAKCSDLSLRFATSYPMDARGLFFFGVNQLEHEADIRFSLLPINSMRRTFLHVFCTRVCAVVVLK
jgi:hypothetical protein